ncbi:MAG: radical SAM protein [Desulfuromonas sp.]|nr:MAG: radical SAM protein [Desulfuromonas sp.]
MALSEKRRSQLIATNQQEYQERYAALDFPPAEELAAIQQQRDQLLAELSQQVEIGCHGTKLDMRNLAPGCRSGISGGWSCLFISGRCNCNCFYCPTDQSDLGLPTTNTLTFRHPADYVSYLERFGFNGASISGGEPLLTPKRSLGFLAAIKRRFGSNLHTWLYTNGTLMTRELAEQLRDVGLDEIRFDIGATDYNLKALRLAAGVIPTLTVEIPAIPEEAETLKRLFNELLESGVNHLNLHQLRLTPYNYPRLLPRNSRYLHGEKVTVLDSELAALELIRFGMEQGIELPINYCSFVYKNRYQSESARRRNAIVVAKSHESLTENGYIRTLTLRGERHLLATLQARFSENGFATELWSMSRSGEQLAIHPVLWPLVEPAGLQLQIDYASASQQAAISYRNPFSVVELSPRQKIIIERNRVTASIELTEEQAELYGRRFLVGRPDETSLPEESPWEELTRFERLSEGLQNYY